jgi:KaiC/GvpD/RAD55 family RecA-like ATPase
LSEAAVSISRVEAPPRVPPIRVNVEPCLPPELSTFVSKIGSRSLLVRGPPGSGKSTLGLALLEAFEGTRILVTNRVDEVELREDYPWLQLDGANPIQVVEAQDSSRGLNEAAEAVNSISGLVTGADSADMRNFLLLPEAIQVAYALIDVNRPSIVVVDSWDALVEDFMEKGNSTKRPVATREEVERLLLSYMRRTSVTLVLILERDIQSQLDYLVHAVVTTERKTVDGRLERWLYVPKLRGQRIETPSYPFTLEGARFRALPPFRFRKKSAGSRAAHAVEGEPSPEEYHDKIWPGCVDFVMAFGMLEIGTTTVIETDSEVPDTITHLLLDPPIVQTIRAGGRVMLIPSPGSRLVEFYDPLRAIFSAEVLAAQLRIFSAAGKQAIPVEVEPVMFALPESKGTGDDPIFHTAFDFIGGGGRTGVPNLIIRTTGGERALSQALGLGVTPENFAGIAAAYVNRLATHQIIVGNTGDALLASLNDLGTMHLQVRAHLGRYFINGLRPFTPLYAITEAGDVCPYRLTRMV